jgi:hypothetical protein
MAGQIVSSQTETKFPVDPVHGMLYELRRGIIYQYDSSVKSWVKIASENLPPRLATFAESGAMSSEDFKKLNRLVIPPPMSTITSDQCSVTFDTGMISLYGDDEIVDVTGQVELRNTGSDGEILSKIFPFHTHQHTYTFDFTLSMDKLIEELEDRNQIKIEGKKGETGKTGDEGTKGITRVFTGITGPQGNEGDNAPCTTVVQRDPLPLEIKNTVDKAVVGAQIEFIDDTKYKVVFQRKSVVSPAAKKLDLTGDESSWVLCVESIVGNPQKVNYIDLNPIVESIHQKFISELQRLKKGYENIADFWIQIMSDMFDEQKSALCCALEFCMSRTKNLEARRHMESVAAAATTGGKIRLNPRDEEAAEKMAGFKGNPNQSVELGGRTMIPGLGEPFGEEFDDECVPGATGEDKSFTVLKNGTVSISSEDGLLRNAIKAAGTTGDLQIRLIQNSKNGQLTVDDDGAFEYSPNTDFVGQDDFKFAVVLEDGTGQSPEYTTNLNVVEIVPASPTISFNIKSQAINEGGIEQFVKKPGVLIKATNIRGLPVTARLSSCGGVLPCKLKYGTITKFSSNGAFKYIPNEGVKNKTDTFKFIVNDGQYDSADITAELKIDVPIGAKDVIVMMIASESNEYTLPLSKGDVGMNRYLDDMSAWESYVEINNIDTAIALMHPVASTKTIVNTPLADDTTHAWLLPKEFHRKLPESDHAFTDKVYYGTVGRNPSGDSFLNKSCKFEDLKDHFINVAGNIVPATLVIVINNSALMKESVVQPALESFIAWYKSWSASVSGTEGCVHTTTMQSERWMEASLIALKDGVKVCGLHKPVNTPGDSLVDVNMDALAADLQSDGVPILVNPLIHSGSSNHGAEILLSAGEYLAIIDESMAMTDGFYSSNIRIKHVKDDKVEYSQFLHKGKFRTEEESKEAYEGLSVTFRHDGGLVSFYNPDYVTEADGYTSLTVRKIGEYKKVIEYQSGLCGMKVEKLQWYGKGWQNDRCCALVVNVAGQDYIIMKRSIGNNTTCGGGESADSPCIAAFIEEHGHPAFAWPTLDGEKFAPIPDVTEITFKYDQKLVELALQNISNGFYKNPKGRSQNPEHFVDQFSIILFPEVL